MPRSRPSLSVVSDAAGIAVGPRPFHPGPDTASSLSAAPSGTEAPSLSLPLDADFRRTWSAFGGTKARGRLHSLHPVHAGDIGAQTGFALTALAWLGASSPIGSARRPLLWVQDRHGRLDAGRPYGLGFASFGIRPADVVLVAARNTLEALTAAEMGLDAGELHGVLVELPPSLPADMLRLGKRLALRAERARTACFFLHGGTRPAAMPVATRWFVSTAPAVATDDGRALAAVTLTLEKNRFGPTGRWRSGLASPPLSSSIKGWCHDDPTAAHASSPDPVAVAAAPRDRPHPAPGELVPAA